MPGEFPQILADMSSPKMRRLEKSGIAISGSSTFFLKDIVMLLQHPVNGNETLLLLPIRSWEEQKHTSSHEFEQEQFFVKSHGDLRNRVIIVIVKL